MRGLNIFLAGMALGAIVMKYVSPMNEKRRKAEVGYARAWHRFGKKWKKMGLKIPPGMERFG